MKKSEMVKKFLEKIEDKENGITVEYERYSYWENQPVVVVDNARIAWFVTTKNCGGNSTGLVGIEETMTTRELTEFFDNVLCRVQNAVKEKGHYSELIEKMLNSIGG